MEKQEAEIDVVIQWLHDRLPFGIRPGLDRILALLARLDHPEKTMPVIHVAGTNGKGSVVTYLRCLLMELGLKVGTYTSPYIETFNERICIDGVPISGADLFQEVTKVRPLVAEMDQSESLKGATEFEVLTAMMFDYFRLQQVDVAIVEVGLGGLLDCTNVMVPVVSTIVTVGLDHTDILGTQIADIAHQKAGIIKAGRPVVVGRVTDDVFTVLASEAAAHESSILRLGTDYAGIAGGVTEEWEEIFDYTSAAGQIKNLKTPLLGQHQVDNAAVALATFQLYCQEKQLHWQQKDLRKALLKARWPGRMERLNQEPLLILDGAHNEPAIEVLVNNLKNEFKGRDIYLLFAAIQTKDAKEMLKKLQTIPASSLVVTTFDYPKAYSAEKLAALCQKPVALAENWQVGLAQICQGASSEDVIVVTGSLYFISQVRHFLLEDDHEAI